MVGQLLFQSNLDCCSLDCLKELNKIDKQKKLKEAGSIINDGKTKGLLIKPNSTINFVSAILADSHESIKEKLESIIKSS